MYILDCFKIFKAECEYLQLDLRLGSPLNDPEIDGGSAAH